MTTKDMQEAVSVILAEADRPISTEDAMIWLREVCDSARLLHRAFVRQCNGYSPREYAYPERARARDNRVVDNEKGYLRQSFHDLGLGLYLNDDPRENPVGILTPKTGRFNTMGGRECGWRL